MTTLEKPLPIPNALSQPYWDAAIKGCLVLQCCAQCNTVRHYPRLLCTHCYSDQYTWKDSLAKGTIHSWTVAHHAFHAAFKEDLPYTLVTVDLAEGVRAMGVWKSSQQPQIGMPVQGEFLLSEGRADLQFLPLSTT